MDAGVELKETEDGSASDSSFVDLPPVKGRSSLSQRLSLCRENCGNGLQLSDRRDRKEDEHQIILEYTSKLQEETKSWKAILEKMKGQCMDVITRKKTLVITLETCADSLTEEDQQFLKDCPNYQQISDDFDALVEMSAISSRANWKMLSSLQKVLHRMKQQEDSSRSFLLGLN